MVCTPPGGPSATQTPRRKDQLMQHQHQHEEHEATGLEIAIVGMAARVPGAADIDTFWDNIRKGVESVVHYTAAQLRERGVAQALIDDPHYVKAGVPFDGADLFVGLSGPALTAPEAEAWREAPPRGAILFCRYIEDPSQLAEMCEKLLANPLIEDYEIVG